jgi:hypothetical protein
MKRFQRTVVGGLFIILAQCAPAGWASAQGTQPEAQMSGSGRRAMPATSVDKLDEGERRLVEGSRDSILSTGFSTRYFDEHFRLEQVIDRPGERRVVWKYSVGDYEVLVQDLIGYRTEAGRRLDVHAIADTLGATRDIVRTIKRSTAERLMRRCLGRNAPSAVVFQSLADGRKSALYLTAQAAGARDARGEREARERREQKRDARGTQPGEMREDDEEGAPFFIAYVNLETGRCVKTRGISR